MRQNSTSYSHVIDTYAWIEYFRASREGETARKYIEQEGSATPAIVVAEVSRKTLARSRGRNETKDGRVKHLEFIRSASQILQLDFDEAASAGELDVEMKKNVRGWD